MKRHVSIYTVVMPSQPDVEYRLLSFLSGRPKGMATADVYSPLSDLMKLTFEQQRAKVRDSDELAWENLVRQARRRMVDAGFIDRSQRGWWCLTPAGFEEVRQRELARIELEALVKGL